MELIAPTNWDDGLIPEYKAAGIVEVYGKLAIDAIGGGRPPYILPNLNKKEAAKHIRRYREAGMSFNYILNAPCMESREFTRSGRAQIRSLLSWLVNSGVDRVTVTIPYISQFIKETFPYLKVNVSVFAGVDCVDKALFWQTMGVDAITLSQIALNRNFSQLKLIRKNVTCKLRLIGNTGCLYRCPLMGYHALTSSHASQLKNLNRAGFMIDYCSLYCRYWRLKDLSRFIKSNWIRPEDLHVYEKIGIDGIKLVDRSCSTEQLIKIVKSYSQRSFDGNLLDLLPLFQGRSPSTKNNFALKIRYFFHPFEFNLFSLHRLRRLVQNLELYIDNRKLDGFIDKFLKEDCSTKDCSECRYCDQIAGQVIQYDTQYLTGLITAYEEFIADLARGKI